DFAAQFRRACDVRPTGEAEQLSFCANTERCLAGHGGRLYRVGGDALRECVRVFPRDIWRAPLAAKPENWVKSGFSRGQEFTSPRLRGGWPHAKQVRNGGVVTCWKQSDENWSRAGRNWTKILPCKNALSVSA